MGVWGMQIFKYPYVIITIFIFIFLVMGIIGLCFMIKSVKTSKGTETKSFCSIGKIKDTFERATANRSQRCLVYISISLDNMKRLYSETKATRLYEQVQSMLFNHLCIGIDGDISVYGEGNFIALNGLESKNIEQCISECFEEINRSFVQVGAVNVIRINFGYYCTNATEVSFDKALQRAKQACSMAEDKKALYCEWDNSQGKEFERKIKIENNIQNEIDNNRFYLQYQPILDAKTNEIIGAEVLSRLNSETEGILTPRDFLSAVNNVGLNEKFDYYIFEKTCKWIANDQENRMQYVYTINFSRYTLCDPNLAEILIETVEKYKIKFANLAIEILEDKSLSDEQKTMVIQNVTRLKEKGILVLLDDFGRGYSSFGDLANFDIDIVKIDKSMTQNASNEAGFLILKNIIQTAHDLGFKTLCEGVETQEHKQAALNAGCDMFQGYYFYHPMSVAQFETLSKK